MITKRKKLEKKPLVKLTKFRPYVFSRHPSHEILRTNLPLMPFRSVVRLGSTTQHDKDRVECNTIEGVKNSASKLRMKECFTRAGVKTANWFISRNNEFLEPELHPQEGLIYIPIPIERVRNFEYPIIAKSHFGSRGEGNYKLDTEEQFRNWTRNRDLSGYIFEKFHNYTREYRLHITEEGCFYTCRKLLRNDAPENTWQRHDDVCSWILETNPSFKKPNNWNLIIEDCVKALKSLKLDIGAFDVLVQGTREGRERESPKWIILESCSAPSFGNITAEKYKEQIPIVLKKKFLENN